jgi:ABC-2 type transport system permease protein
LRVRAVAVKETWALLRQPQLLLLLLIGPVLVMAAFALSFKVENIIIPTVLVVVEPGSGGAELFERYRSDFDRHTNFAGTTDDPQEAQERLQRGEVDAVITVPSDPYETVAAGEQAVLRVTYSSINPVFATAVPDRTYRLLSDLNRSLVQEGIEQEIGSVREARERVDEVERELEEANRLAQTLASEEARDSTAELDASLAELERSLEELQDAPGETGEDASAALEDVRAAREQLAEVREVQEAGAEGIRRETGLAGLQASLDDLQRAFERIPDAPPEVLANPLRVNIQNLASPPSLIGFYAPGVLALLIQHIAASLASLSIIRERLNGAQEFFEVSPLGTGELLAGKFLAYFVLVLGANLAVVVALERFLGAPVEGGLPAAVLVMALVTFASLGLGFLVSALARSQLQAVQVSMLLLIGSVFFTGFLFPLGDMEQPGVGISYFLPATYAIRALQDVMIRGEAISFFDVGGLVVIGTICIAGARLLMARKKGA